MFYYNVFLKDGEKITTKQTDVNLMDVFKNGITPELGNEKSLIILPNVIVVSSELAALEVVEVKESE